MANHLNDAALPALEHALRNIFARVQLPEDLRYAASIALRTAHDVPARKRGPRYYLSGPMSNLPDNNFPAFAAAAQRLRAHGWNVISPHELVNDPAATWQDCMRVDIKALVDCTHVVLLKGHERSRGAKVERYIGAALGMDEMTLDRAYERAHAQHEAAMADEARAQT